MWNIRKVLQSCHLTISFKKNKELKPTFVIPFRDPFLKVELFFFFSRSIKKTLVFETVIIILKTYIKMSIYVGVFQYVLTMTLKIHV